MIDLAVAKRIKDAKAKHELHVQLLMATNEVSKSQAQILAYLYGPLGLDDLMAALKPAPLAEPKK